MLERTALKGRLVNVREMFNAALQLPQDATLRLSAMVSDDGKLHQTLVCDQESAWAIWEADPDSHRVYFGSEQSHESDMPCIEGAATVNEFVNSLLFLHPASSLIICGSGDDLHMSYFDTIKTIGGVTWGAKSVPFWTT